MSRCSAGRQLAHGGLDLGGCVTARDFDIADAGFAQRFPLHGITRCGLAAEMVTGALELDRVQRAAIAIDDEQVDAFGVDGKERVLVGDGKDFGSVSV